MCSHTKTKRHTWPESTNDRKHKFIHLRHWRTLTETHKGNKTQRKLVLPLHSGAKYPVSEDNCEENPGVKQLEHNTTAVHTITTRKLRVWCRNNNIPGGPDFKRLGQEIRTLKMHSPTSVTKISHLINWFSWNFQEILPGFTTDSLLIQDDQHHQIPLRKHT